MKKDIFNINNTESFDSVEKNKGKIYYIPLSSLIENKLNDINEKYDTKDDFEKLCSSIIEYGLRTPLAVTKANDNYLIQSGHRRKKALQELFKNGEKIYFNSVELTPESIPVLITKEYKNEFDQFASLQSFNIQRTTNKERNIELAKRQKQILEKLEKEGYKFEGRKRDIIGRMFNVSGKTIDRWTEGKKVSIGEQIIRNLVNSKNKIIKNKTSISKQEFSKIEKEIKSLEEVVLADAGHVSRKGDK